MTTKEKEVPFRQIHHVLVPVLLLGNLLSLSVEGLNETVNHCASPCPSQGAYIQAKQDWQDSNWEFSPQTQQNKMEIKIGAAQMLESTEDGSAALLP